MLVQAGRTNLLIDAGLPLRTLSSLLARRGVPANGLQAILLTHEHTDHACGAGPLARRMGTPLVANAATLDATAARDDLPFLATELPTGAEMGIGEIEVRSFPVSHDAADPVGFVLQAGGVQVTYFTDCGCITPDLEEALRGAHLGIIEANHDTDWLWRGPYTPEMKARVASPTGHLSNHDCADLIARRLEEGGAFCVWLAHLSRVNNSPSLARRSVLMRIQDQTRVPVALEVALRDHPSVSWQSGVRAVQLPLL